jgi:GNAT superfamily N-acetyltransferase
VRTVRNDVEIVELTDSTWPLLEKLFGPGGVQGGCWCAFFRMTSGDFRRTSPREHHALVRAEVGAGKPFGLLALRSGDPIGWVAVSPRLDNVRLRTSQIAAPASREQARDLADTWSVTCFFIHRKARRTSLSARLLAAAVDYASARGARFVEGYPVDPEDAKRESASLYHGTVGTFAGAGFELVERRGTRRALMRLGLPR